MNTGIAVVVVAYILVMFVIAAWLKKRVKDDADYLLAGRKMGPMLIAVMLLAINFGGAFVLGTSQDAYSVGFAAISFAIGISVGLVFLALFVARRARGSKFVTVPDILEYRFSSQPVRLMASALSIIALTGILAAQIGAVASSLTVLGLPLQLGAVIGTAVIIAFTVMSGMWGVAVTDFIQFLVIVIGLVLVALISVNAAGGLGAIGDSFAARGVDNPFNPLSQGWSFFLGAALPVVIHKQVGQDVMQRVFSARSATTASIGAGVAGVLTLLFAVFPALAGMATRVLVPELDPSIGVMPTLIDTVLPFWAAGILIAAIISAVVSTANALLLAAVSNISTDFLLRFTTIGNSPDRQLRWSRIVTLLLGVFGLVVSLLVPGIIQVLVLAFTMYGSGVFVSFMFGLFTSFGGRRASFTSMVAGAGVGLLNVVGLVTFGPMPGIAGAIAVSLVLYVTVALLAGERVVTSRTDRSLAVEHV